MECKGENCTAAKTLKMVVEEMNCVKQDLAKEVEKNQLLEESIEIERLKSPKSMGSVDLILKGPV